MLTTPEAVTDGCSPHYYRGHAARRLAEHAWAIIRTKALEDGFPVEGAYLDVDEDILEGHDQAIVVVDTAGTSKEVFAFWDEVGDAYQRWAEGLDTKSRETALYKIRLFFNWTD